MAFRILLQCISVVACLLLLLILLLLLLKLDILLSRLLVLSHHFLGSLNITCKNVSGKFTLLSSGYLPSGIRPLSICANGRICFLLRFICLWTSLCIPLIVINVIKYDALHINYIICVDSLATYETLSKLLVIVVAGYPREIHFP